MSNKLFKYFTNWINKIKIMMFFTVVTKNSG